MKKENIYTNEEKKRELYPIELIKTGVYFLTLGARRSVGGFLPYDPIRSLVLYKLEKVDDGYLPLNREYKPLGISCYHPYIDSYFDYPFLTIPKDMVNIDLTEEGYLFNDATFPKHKKNKERYVELLESVFLNKILFRNFVR